MARYVPFGAGNSSSGAPFGVLRHEMINDTKGGQLQDARDSGPLLVRELEESKYEVVAGARSLKKRRNWQNSKNFPSAQ
jgi:hypothetical protein